MEKDGTSVKWQKTAVGQMHHNSTFLTPELGGTWLSIFFYFCQKNRFFLESFDHMRHLILIALDINSISFNDRIRDAVLGGSPFGHPLQQGFVTGLGLQVTTFLLLIPY